MRLINVETFKLESHQADKLPPYAILSHTWDTEGGEVSFTEFENGQRIHKYDQVTQNKPGFKKIVQLCRIAKCNGISHVWIDTACIDKSSSSELTEAINSMFQWYTLAKVCYAYLSDVKLPMGVKPMELSDIMRDQLLRGSRWFTRGWTLQELLAPKDLEFFDADWKEMGGKMSYCSVISSITGIGQDIIQKYATPQTSRSLLPTGVESFHSGWLYLTRMTWAACRETTRAEDMAYSLMGIFGVNMPLLYGEGLETAFQRLQYELFRFSSSTSLLAWGIDSDHSIKASFDRDEIFPKTLARQSILAGSPSQFVSTSKQIYGFYHTTSDHMSWTINNRGIKTEMKVITHESWFVEEPIDERGYQRRHDLAIAVLPYKPCREEQNYFGFLMAGNSLAHMYNRVSSLHGAATVKIPTRLAVHAKSQTIFLSEAYVDREWRTPSAREKVVFIEAPEHEVQNVITRHCEWNAEEQQLMLHRDTQETIQEALFRVIDKNDPDSYFNFLVSNTIVLSDAMASSSLQPEDWRFRKIGIFAIPNEDVNKFLEEPSPLKPHSIAAKSEIVVTLPNANVAVSIQENNLWWDMIYVLSIQTKTNV